jgi:predicted permease
LTDLLSLFSNNILPIFLVAGAGYLAARTLHVTARSISQLAFYILSPCLIFKLLTTSQLSGGEVTRMVGFTLVTILAVGLISWLAGRVMRLERHILVAVLLAAMFNNSGNYGLSLILFAFDKATLAYASLYFITSLILVYTLGVVIASLGKSNLRDAVLGLFKLPGVYAVILALIFNYFRWTLPMPLERSVSILSDATIPVLLLIMGVQLQNSRWSDHLPALGLANLIRLVAAPLLALGISTLFQLKGPAYQAGVIESAMPSAVVLTVLATEYDIEPAFLTTAVFTSTLLSPLTLTPLLAYLGV